MAKTLTLELGYANTKSTRTFVIENVADEVVAGAAAKVKAINASLAAGTDDGLSDFFISDDYDATTDPQNVVGKLDRIISLHSTGVETTKLI